MNITLTITGDAINPEIAQMLQALGVALSEDRKAAIKPEIAEAKATESITEQPVKKTRKRKTADPESTTEISEASKDAIEEQPEDNKAITMESLREKVVFLAKSGKTDEVKEAFEAVSATKLSDVKKADYATLDEKLSSI